MSQAADLLKRGQRAHAAQYPAGTVTINGQAYTGFATSGVKRERDLISGGWLPGRKVTFWAPVSAFEIAGQPLPEARQHLTWLSETYAIENVGFDAAKATCILSCDNPDK